VSKDKSIIGRSVVGGLLFGEIGAIIGGMSGLQQGQEHIGGDLFLISFNYAEFGKTVLGVGVENGVVKFLKKYNELNSSNRDSQENKNINESIYLIGNYGASQIIEEQ
jgi:hypothetical protein